MGDDLTDDERRVCREALAFLALGHEAMIRQFGELNRQWIKRDAETARRLIRERFQPKGEGATA